MAKASIFMKHVVQGESTIEVGAGSIVVTASNGLLVVQERSGTHLFAAPLENVNHVQIDARQSA